MLEKYAYIQTVFFPSVQYTHALTCTYSHMLVHTFTYVLKKVTAGVNPIKETQLYKSKVKISVCQSAYSILHFRELTTRPERFNAVKNSLLILAAIAM